VLLKYDESNVLEMRRCGAVTLVRVQVGWLGSHPMTIPCGACRIVISGIARFDQVHATTSYEFHNGKETDATDQPDYYLEVSGELLTERLKRYEGGPYVWSPPPFFQALSFMGQDRYLEFKKRTLQFLYMCKNDWPTVRRVNELWVSSQADFLVAEVRKFLPADKFPMNNEAEMVRGVHQLNLLFFSPIIDQKEFDSRSLFIFDELPNIAASRAHVFIDLLLFFAGTQVAAEYEQKILGRLQAFVDIFRLLIPVFAQHFYEDPKMAEGKALTTAGFEDLKHYYADTYEVLSEILPLIIAFNNLKLRGDFKKMKVKRRDVTSIEDLLQKSKGDRGQFLEGDEAFDRLLHPDLDNKLRNAIAHHSYTYDVVSQEVTYFPSGVSGKGDAIVISLQGFAMRCWRAHQRVLDVMELVYQTRKLYYVVVKRQKPVDPSVFKTHKTSRSKSKKSRPKP
jgi:hypothetical protein